MGECSTLSQSLPSGSGLGMKRHHSGDDTDESSAQTKVIRNDISTNDICRRLIDSPERRTDPGSETEFSFQEEETDLCCRSTTSSSSDWSEGNGVGRVEFEVRSPNEGPNPFGDSSTASDASVNELRVVIPQPKDEAGNSSCVSSGSSDVFDPEIPRRDYWTCLQCSNVNNRPAFRYCEKCYKVRREMFQSRVKPRKRRKQKSLKQTKTVKTCTNKFQPGSTMLAGTVKSYDSVKTSPIAFSGIKLESCSQENKDSGMASSQTSGVACSQTAVGGKNSDSDSSLSSDSGADFHGIKLSSTRGRSLEVNSNVLPQDVHSATLGDRSSLSIRQFPLARAINTCEDIDEVDSVQASSCGADKIDISPSDLPRDIYKNSVKTQTDLCFIAKSEIAKEKPIVGDEKCMTCYSRPMDAIFVHSTYAHMCCCYKCTVRVWKTTKRCPVCNCKVMNVLRLFKVS